MKKIVYIIPGYAESTKYKAYKQIAQFFRSKNIRPIPIGINWKYNVMSDYVSEFLSKYKMAKNQEVYLFGFSFGAMIAFIAAIRIKPKMLILCSLSPFFKEDLKFQPKSWKIRSGKKMMNDLAKYKFNILSKEINCETILIVGEKEHKLCKRRANDANNKLKKSKLIMISKGKHKIKQREYLETLKKIISKL